MVPQQLEILKEKDVCIIYRKAAKQRVWNC